MLEGQSVTLPDANKQKNLKSLLTDTFGISLRYILRCTQGKKIAVLRKLGLSVSDIKMVLNDKNKSALYNVSTKKAFEIEMMKSKQELAQNQD